MSRPLLRDGQLLAGAPPAGRFGSWERLGMICLAPCTIRQRDGLSRFSLTATPRRSPRPAFGSRAGHRQERRPGAVVEEFRQRVDDTPLSVDRILHRADSSGFGGRDRDAFTAGPQQAGGCRSRARNGWITPGRRACRNRISPFGHTLSNYRYVVCD